MFDVIIDVMAEQNTNEENIDDDGTGLDTEFDALFKELNTELYPGCSWMSSLNFLAKLMHIKVINKWTDTSFNQLLGFLRDAFPNENHIPTSHYEAKKKLRKIGLGYQSIHACINDYALFWKDNDSMQNCPICDESKWVNPNTTWKKVPQKVLRYFPLTSRLRRRYSSTLTAKAMIWHNTGRSTDGMMRHPVDGKAWKEFDKRYPEFAKEPRNVRLGLAADGFNSFGNMSQSYSMWLVVLTTYNTPPVYMRWMYPFERYMKKLKSYVRNKAKPEGSIAEGYVAEEALTFCSMYFEGIQTKFHRLDRNADVDIPKRQLHVFSSSCRPISANKIIHLCDKASKSLEWFVLNNCDEMERFKS